MSTTFTLKMVIDQKDMELEYKSAKHMENDSGLLALFTDGLVSKCEVHAAGKRIFGLPFMEWDRLVAEVYSKFGGSHARQG